MAAQSLPGDVRIGGLALGLAYGLFFGLTVFGIRGAVEDEAEEEFEFADSRYDRLSDDQRELLHRRYAERRNDPTVAWLVGFFFGELGAHYFYRGETWWGVGYLVISALAIGSIVLLGTPFGVWSLAPVALWSGWIRLDAVLTIFRVRDANNYRAARLLRELDGRG